MSFFKRFSHHLRIQTNFYCPNLPKFAQIPNWWRHTGSCVHFQLTRPIFSDSANIFSLEYIKQCYLVPKLYGFRITLCITVYRVKCISFAKTPQVTSSTVGKNMEFNICVFLGLLKSPTLKCSRIVKNLYFSMRFFLLFRKWWVLCK